MANLRKQAEKGKRLYGACELGQGKKNDLWV